MLLVGSKERAEAKARIHSKRKRCTANACTSERATFLPVSPRLPLISSGYFSTGVTPRIKCLLLRVLFIASLFVVVVFPPSFFFSSINTCLAYADATRKKKSCVMTSRNVPLPALHHSAPPYSTPPHRKSGRVKKSAFSLDGYLSSTQTRLSATLPLPSKTTAASGAALPQQHNSSVFQGGAKERSLMSPAEALLASEAAFAPLRSSPAVPPAGSSPLLSCVPGVSPAASVVGGAGSAWRSQLLRCETQLRELVAQGVREPPSLGRIVQVVNLFDHLISVVQVDQGNAFLGPLLRLFRVEFCRSIFLDGSGPPEAGAASSASNTSGSYDTVAGGLPHTYFDETASLQRTKAALTSTLASGVSGETMLLLEHQLEDKAEQLTWYEGELERVRIQYEQVAEECVALRKALEEQQRDNATTQKQMRQEMQSLHVENKDLQIQLFRLRKQISGGMSTLLKDSYRQLKMSKMGLMQRLFNEGDERVALLVMLGQVESRLNEILDSFDNDYVLTPENSRRELQLKMAQGVTVLLEDMHYCEASYRRLVGAHHVKIVEKGSDGKSGGGADGRPNEAAAAPLQRIPLSVVHSGDEEEAPDESDGFVAILFDPKIYEQFQVRRAIQTRLQQYAKERDNDEDAKVSRGKPQDDNQHFSFPPTDGTFITAVGGRGTPGDQIVMQQEMLSTLLPGIFGADALTSKAKRDRCSVAAVESAAVVPGANSRVPLSKNDKLKKWSLDSCSIAIGNNGVSPSHSSSGPGATEGSPAASAPPSSRAKPNKLQAVTVPGMRGGGGGGVGGAAVGASARKGGGSTSARLPAPAQRNVSSSSPNAVVVPQESLEDVVERQKAEWVAHVLGPPTASVAFTVPGRHLKRGDVVVVHERSAEVVPAELMMRRVLHRPMEDLCNDRFLSTVEVFTGENPTQQRLLCRVNHVDPSLPIRVPASTNFVKVKYALAENAVPPGTTGRGATVTTNLSSSVPAIAGTGAASTTGCVTAGGGGMSASASSFDSDNANPSTPVFRGNPKLRFFRELSNKALVGDNLGLRYCAGAVNSTTASTVAFQRLHPMSPNRAPEWLLYQQLFGPYRSLAPRMMEVTTIDHVMACASERYFTRMEYRYDECYLRAAGQCASHQMRRDMTERLFKDLHTLSDFQEALVDELEARYGFPELVAKTFYEMLCYLNAVAEKDTVLAAYLDVIRGFAAPTEIHFMSYMLYHLSYCWPEANPSTAVPVDDVRTVLEYVYRNAFNIMSIKPDTILHDYDMATRSAPLNFVNFRQFIASTMAHQEESILLHLHGLFHTYTQRALVDEAGWDTYETVIGKLWRQKDERRSLVRYLTSCLGVHHSSSPTLPQLTFLAASAWSSNLWE
jgi:hypothetical protein